MHRGKRALGGYFTQAADRNAPDIDRTILAHGVLSLKKAFLC